MSNVIYKSQDVGKRLKEMRKRKGLSRIQLANRLNLSEDSIAGYETGKTSIGAEHMTKICQIFDVSADFFYFGKDKSLGVNDIDISLEAWINIFSRLNIRDKQRAFNILRNVFPEIYQ